MTNEKENEEYTRLLQFLLYRKPGILCEYVRYHKDRPIHPGYKKRESTPDNPLVRCAKLLRKFLKVF